MMRRLPRAGFQVGSETRKIDRKRDPNMDVRKAPNVVIIGLGYVGLTLSVALARRGVQAYGIEKRPDVVEKTNAGVPHFAEVGLQAALADVVKI